MSSARVVILAAISFFLFAQVGSAQTEPTDVTGNRVFVGVSSDVSFDRVRGLYHYRYILNNAWDSREGIELFAIRIGGDAIADVLNPSAPNGWVFSADSERPILTWTASDTSGFEANDSAALPASKFQVNPGQSLAGFSFDSHIGPKFVRYYAQGHVEGPLAEPGDLDDEHSYETLPDYTQIGVNGIVRGPGVVDIDNSPDIRGGITITAPLPNAILIAPLKTSITLQAAAGSHSIFHVELNGVDITSSFSAGTGAGAYYATLAMGTSPIQNGVNYLIASVAGTNDSGEEATGYATKTSFHVFATVLGDINNDGVVDCRDIAIVKAALGKKVGEIGFDASGDVNSDGIVDLEDFLYVYRHVPKAERGNCCDEKWLFSEIISHLRLKGLDFNVEDNSDDIDLLIEKFAWLIDPQ